MDILTEPWYEDCVALANEIMEPGKSYIKEDLQFLIEEKLNIDYRKADMVFNTLVSENAVYHVPGTDFYKLNYQVNQLISKKIDEDWTEMLDEIESFFKSKSLKKEIKLDSVTIIKNVDEFIKSHIELLRFNNGNSLYRPYLDRLIALKKHGPVGVIANE